MIITTILAVSFAPQHAQAADDPRVDIRWSNVPARMQLTEFASRYQRGLVLDRRVDPGQPLELTASSATVDEIFVRAAEALKLSTTKIGPLVYLGPATTASRLRTLAALRRADAQQLPTAPRAAWLIPQASHWDELVAPADLVARLAAAAGAKVLDPAMIPHDLWAAADWPASSPIDRLTMIAAQFDLTFAFEDQGRAIRLMPIPARVAIERRYTIPRDPVARAAEWRRLAPQAQIDVEGTQLVVSATIEEHELLTGQRPAAAARPGAAAANMPTSIQRHTLAVDDVPLDKLLAALGQKLGLTIEIDRKTCAAAGIKLDQLVSLRADKLELDELLARLLQPLQLGFSREGTTVKIAPRSAEK